MKDRSRNVTAADLGAALAVVVLLFGGIIIAKFHSAPIGLSMFGALVMWCIYSWIKTPALEKEKMAEAVARQERTPLGKVLGIGHYISGAVVIAVLIWNLVKWATSN